MRRRGSGGYAGTISAVAGSLGATLRQAAGCGHAEAQLRGGWRTPQPVGGGFGVPAVGGSKLWITKVNAPFNQKYWYLTRGTIKARGDPVKMNVGLMIRALSLTAM